ncbi:TPA: toprim domain-containing protein [Photobacterium damselae]
MQKLPSDFVRHLACNECGSSDANGIYTDGHQYCFSCETYVPPSKEDEEQGTKEVPSNPANPFLTDEDDTEEPSTFKPVFGEFQPLKARGITKDTCAKYEYMVGRYNGQPVQIQNVRNNKGKLIGQKLRFADKTFSVLGRISGSDIIGRNLFQGGKKLIITEGEIDMLTLSQVQGNKYPVVSLAQGANSAKRAIASNLDWLKQFDELIIAFDMDEVGQQAAKDAAELLVGYMKVSFMKLPLKDANDMLKAGRVEELIQAIWKTEPYRPDGLVSIKDLKEKLRANRVPKQGLPYWCDGLNKQLFGRHYGQLILLGAGTGVGKTDFLTQQMEYDIKTLDLDVCGYLLEQDPEETFKRLMGKLHGKRFHVPDGSWTETEFDAALEEPCLEKVELYDNFGITCWDNLHSKLLYQVARGKKLFYIDHLTALATGSDERQEKEELEYVCAEMAAFAKRHQVIITAISHLTTPDKGYSHEEGGRVTIRQFKGSRAIGYWAHIMFGLERNQQAEDIIERQTTILRILKDRFTGQGTGTTIRMGYIMSEGRLYEMKDGEEPIPDEPELEDFF